MSDTTAASFNGPISILDYVAIAPGSTATDAIARSIELSQTVERLGYRRHWFSEHHNTRGLACTAPEALRARSSVSVTSSARMLVHSFQAMM